MVQLIVILAALMLLAGFVVLEFYERSRGIRLFSEKREWLDREAARVMFIIEHVDFAAFLRDLIRHLVRNVGHDIAHLSLQFVRAIERLLARIVRHFRSRQVVTHAPRETARAFVKTLSDFKGSLKAAAPEVNEVQVQ